MTWILQGHAARALALIRMPSRRAPTRTGAVRLETSATDAAHMAACSSALHPLRLVCLARHPRANQVCRFVYDCHAWGVYCTVTAFAVGSRGTCPDAYPYPFSADGLYLHRCCTSALGNHTLPRTQSLFESCENDDFVSCSEPPCQASSCIDGEVFGVPCKALDVCQFGCSNQLCTLREVPVLALDGSAALLPHFFSGMACAGQRSMPTRVQRVRRGRKLSP
jgi:hypothetical protein